MSEVVEGKPQPEKPFLQDMWGRGRNRLLSPGCMSLAGAALGMALFAYGAWTLYQESRDRTIAFNKPSAVSAPLAIGLIGGFMIGGATLYWVTRENS